jgi:hypothetical protein
MRNGCLKLVLALVVCLSAYGPARAQADKCKSCREQLKTCKANYSGKTCNSEYTICMKSCRAK